jgi:lycopene cyclase domain-containing protein
MPSLYLILDLAVIAVPFALSFDRKVAFYKNWRYLFPAIFISASLFIAWDIWFTANGIWGFNESYLIGAKIFNLPIEEVLFFVLVPYACIFIYETIKAYIQKDLLVNASKWIELILLLVLIPLAFLNTDKWYTFSAFGLAILLLLIQLVFKFNWAGRFWLSFGVCMIPFLIVNGILTGTGINEQVVWYNNAHNLGFRIGTIPVEDTIYALSLLLIPINLFELFKKSASK